MLRFCLFSLLFSTFAFSKRISIKTKGPSLSVKAKGIFKKRISIFGLNLLATKKVKNSKFIHAAHILAEYLDNNQDGIVDDPKVLSYMVQEKATLIMFESDSERDDLEDKIDDIKLGNYQDLFDEETKPGGRDKGEFDGSLEEILHLITFTGYYRAYPKVFGPQKSLITKAMDRARGGHFRTVPKAGYPRKAWYTYNDKTCDYNCMVTEYFYWALTSYLGAQDFDLRGSSIENEWKLNTRKKLKEKDDLIYNVLKNPKYKLPQKIPRGKHKLLKNIIIDFY
jgi:hypothetical protein